MAAVDENSVTTLVDTLVGGMTATKSLQLKAAYGELLGIFCKATDESIEDCASSMLQALISLYSETDKQVLKIALDALNLLTAALPKEAIAPRVEMLRTCVLEQVTDVFGKRKMDELPGFCQPKGVLPIWPLYQHALLTAKSPKVRQTAAEGLGEMVELTSPKALAPMVIKMTGPLIRVVGDRFPPHVKAAILHTLGLLLMRNGRFLRTFVPQLQTTFVKVRTVLFVFVTSSC